MDGARTRSTVWRVVLALLLAYTPTAWSQAQRDTPAATGPIIVTGRVTTGDFDAPLARVRVSVPGSDSAQSQLTDQDGQFQLIVPGGTGGLRLTKPGYAPQSVERRALRTGVLLPVRMPRGGAINGMVTDSLGAPAVNMPVRVRRVTDETSPNAGNAQFMAETDDQGEFRVGNLPAGRYSVAPGGRGGRGAGGGSAAFIDLLGGRGEELRALLQGVNQDQLREVVDALGLPFEFGGRGGDGFGRAGDTPDGGNPDGDQNGARGGGNRGFRGFNPNGQAQQPPEQGQAQGQDGQPQPPQGRGGRGRGRGGDPGARGAASDAAANLPTVDVMAGQDASISLTMDDQGAAVLEQALRLAAAVSSARTTGVAQTTAGEVRGRVLGSDGRPLKGATVQLNPVGATGARRSAVTDDAGRYEMTGIAAGSYRARVTKAGLADVEYGQKRTLQSGRIITVADKQRVQGIDVTMPKASVITGRLTDEWGDPLEGASLQVWESTFAEGRTTLAVVPGVRSRRTDDRGQFRLYSLLPGNYYVVASEQNGGERGPDDEAGSARIFYPGTMSALAAAPIQIEAGQDAFGVDFTFTSVRASQIRGIAVSSTTGQAARGRAVLAVSERSGEPMLPLQSARVEEDGSFVFNGVAAGDYVVQIMSNAGPQAEGRGGRGGRGGNDGRGRGGAGDNGGRGGGGQGANQGGGAGQGRGGGRQGTAATGTPQGGGTGGGRQGQAAAAGAQGGGAGQRGAGGGQRGGGAAQQGNRGNPQANGARGRGAATPARNIQRSDREFGMTYVSVGENEIATVRVDTAPGTPVTGQIMLEGDTATALAPSSFGFSAYGVSGDTSPLAGTRQTTAQVRDDWTFVFTDLIGANRLSMTRAPAGWYLKSALINGLNAVEDPVSFDGGNQAVAEVTVTFASGAASIEGRVLDDRRQPTSEFGVVVFSSDPDRWFTRSPYLKFASANQDGTFSVTGLPPAEYLVAALDRIDGGPDFGEWQNPAVLSTLSPTARRVKLGAGEVVSAELRMLRMAR